LIPVNGGEEMKNNLGMEAYTWFHGSRRMVERR
jgi:hypothetical protein